MKTRDAMGLTQLYFWNENEAVSAQTVGELFANGVPRKLCLKGLWLYMLSGAVQEPFTMIEGVRSAPLKPLYASTDEQALIQDKAVAEELLARSLRLAIKKTNCHDAFLSGGIDSGSIVALMRKVWPDEEIRTYCIIHEDPRTDERKWARLTSERNGTKHSEFLLTNSFIKDNIALALDSYDQPSVDGINNWFASKFVADLGIKTILGGEGGDELFAGYGQYAKPRMAYKVAPYFRHLPRWVGRIITKLGPNEKIRKLGQLFGCRYDPYFLTRRQFDEDWALRLLNPEIAHEMLKIKVAELFDEVQTTMGTKGCYPDDIINRCSLMETRHNLLSMFVRDGVQTSTPFGIEIKAPLMDEDVVRLLFRMPGSWKCNDCVTKPLLVHAAGIGLPQECITKRKQGFSLPFDRYFRDGLRDELSAFFNGGGHEIFNGKELKKVWIGYLAGRYSWLRVWQPFVLNWWMCKNKITF